jgi:hypothetical protein
MRQTLDLDLAAVMPAVLATGLLSSLCTITRFPEAFDAGGAPIAATDYDPVTGLVDIPCTAPPIMTIDRVTLTEVRTLEEIRAETDLHVLLGGYYPEIRNDDRAVIDGTVYDIGNVESDSQKQMTRLAVRKVTL